MCGVKSGLHIIGGVYSRYSWYQTIAQGGVWSTAHIRLVLDTNHNAVYGSAGQCLARNQLVVGP